MQRTSAKFGQRNNFPKYIVTLDDLATGFSDGIRIIHLADFLLENDY